MMMVRTIAEAVDIRADFQAFIRMAEIFVIHPGEEVLFSGFYYATLIFFCPPSRVCPSISFHSSANPENSSTTRTMS